MIVLWSTLAFAALTVDPAPTQGVESTVLVTGDDLAPRAGVTIRVVHRPGLDGTRELSVGITDTRGRVRWTPELAGTAVLRSDNDALPLAVAWQGAPPETLILLGLLVAGALVAAGYGVFTGWRRR